MKTQCKSIPKKSQNPKEIYHAHVVVYVLPPAVTFVTADILSLPIRCALSFSRAASLSLSRISHSLCALCSRTLQIAVEQRALARRAALLELLHSLRILRLRG